MPDIETEEPAVMVTAEPAVEAVRSGSGGGTTVTVTLALFCTVVSLQVMV
jgi:hypothetical protein